MKKTNNKYRNNNNNQIYSLNYKFDSTSIAGKFCGTALDLIKRYNELAKEALSSGNYVEMEVFRQYAEHYRKIVTEINEKKNLNQNNRPQPQRTENANPSENSESEAPVSNDNAENETPVAETPIAAPAENIVNTTPAAPAAPRREFKVIEISSAEANAVSASGEAEPKSKPKRVCRSKKAAAAV